MQLFLQLIVLQLELVALALVARQTTFKILHKDEVNRDTSAGASTVTVELRVHDETNLYLYEIEDSSVFVDSFFFLYDWRRRPGRLLVSFAFLFTLSFSFLRHLSTSTTRYNRIR